MYICNVGYVIFKYYNLNGKLDFVIRFYICRVYIVL